MVNLKLNTNDGLTEDSIENYSHSIYGHYLSFEQMKPIKIELCHKF